MLFINFTGHAILRGMSENSKFWSMLDQHPTVVARQLLGSCLVRDIDGHEICVRIVETEAYHQSDAASHSYRGQTPRTAPMFGPSGHAYVYFTYGMHYCFNIVTGVEGEGSAVLVRAVEPVKSEELLSKHRPNKFGAELTNGPAKLCQALAIDKGLNGHNLSQSPLRLEPGRAIEDASAVATTRIGISRDTHRNWRFYIADNPYVSRR